VNASAANAGGTVFTLKNNWWGASPPVTSNFSGTSDINYEPWLTALNGSITANQRPFNTTALGSISPTDGITITTIIQGVTFNLADVGYHNGIGGAQGTRVLEYELGVATNPNFNPATTYNGTAYPAQSAIVSHNIPILTYGNTYYWRVRARNTTDNAGWSDYGTGVSGNYYWFEIRQPQVMLYLTADKDRASAGEIVRYTLSFNNPEPTMNSVVITAILPNEVYSNGTVSVNGVSTYTVRAYNVTSGGTPMTWPVPTANRNEIKRFEVTIPTLNHNASGTFVYQAVVK